MKTDVVHRIATTIAVICWLVVFIGVDFGLILLRCVFVGGTVLEFISNAKFNKLETYAYIFVAFIFSTLAFIHSYNAISRRLKRAS